MDRGKKTEKNSNITFSTINPTWDGQRLGQTKEVSGRSSVR